MMACLYVLYQGRYTIKEALTTREWAMVGSIGDESQVGQIPEHYRAQVQQEGEQMKEAIHQRIFEAGLRTQNYDKGLDKFVRKFEKNEAMSATVAVLSGWQGEHGWAVHVKQCPRRGLLLDTVNGLTDEEALWTALASWAEFNPRKASKRKFPGKLFYPDGASHIFTKFWDYLQDFPSHPEFAQESPVCQAQMSRFSKALGKLRHRNWVPQPAAEAPDKSVEIAEVAALSRLRPIPDGPDQWDVHGLSAVTGGSFSLGSPVVGSGSTPGLGPTDTRATSGRPSQT
jgi:hypothetical protein